MVLVSITYFILNIDLFLAFILYNKQTITIIILHVCIFISIKTTLDNKK